MVHFPQTFFFVSGQLKDTDLDNAAGFADAAFMKELRYGVQNNHLFNLSAGECSMLLL